MNRATHNAYATAAEGQEDMVRLELKYSYLTKAADTDNDGCEELVCKQYAWVDFFKEFAREIMLCDIYWEWC